jgi:hypothetical protein
MTTANAAITNAILLGVAVKVKPTRVGLVVVNVRVEVRLFHVQFPPSGLDMWASNTSVGFDGNV